MSQSNHTYIAIDLKSFYASVECMERGLDPLKTLVVRDVFPGIRILVETKQHTSVSQLIQNLTGMASSPERRIDIYPGGLYG